MQPSDQAYIQEGTWDTIIICDYNIHVYPGLVPMASDIACKSFYLKNKQFKKQNVRHCCSNVALNLLHPKINLNFEN